MTLKQAKLHIDADVDDDGTIENGIFEMEGGLEWTSGIRTGFLFGGNGSPLNSVLATAFGSGETLNKDVIVNLGSGVKTYEVNFRGWEGSDGQWGNDSGAIVTPASATGADPWTQLQVLMRYLQVSAPDSLGGAYRLEIGEYAPSELFDFSGGSDHVEVVAEQPQLTFASEDGPSVFDGSITFLEVADLQQALDSASRLFK